MGSSSEQRYLVSRASEAIISGISEHFIDHSCRIDAIDRASEVSFEASDWDACVQ